MNAASIQQDLRRLMQASFYVSIAIVLVSLIFYLCGVAGARLFTIGLLVGCVTATLNLRVLGIATGAMLQQENARALIGFFASFMVLIGGVLFVVNAERGVVLGFIAGLTMPALAGLAYAFIQRRPEA